MRYSLYILIISAIGYSTTIFLSHELSVVDFGNIIFTIAVIGTIANLCLLGYNEFYQRAYFSKGILPNSFAILTSLALLVPALAIFSWASDTIFTELLSVALPLGIAIILGEYLAIFYRKDEKYLLLAITAKPLSLFTILVAIECLAFNINKNTTFIAAITTVAIHIFMFAYSNNGHMEFSKSKFLIHRKNAFQFFINSNLFLLQVQFGILVLGAYGFSDLIGEFALSYVVVNAASLILSSYFSVYRQAKYYQEIGKSEKNSLIFLVENIFAAIIVAILMVVCSIPIVNFVYPILFDLEKYPNLINLSNMMVLIVLVKCVQAPLASLLNTEDTIKKKKYIFGVGYLIGWIVSYALAAKFSTLGVLMGSLTGELIIAIVIVAIFNRKIQKNYLSIPKTLVDIFFHRVIQLIRRVKACGANLRNVEAIFTGYYGFANFGDDLFLKSIENGIANHHNINVKRASYRILAPVSLHLDETIFSIQSRLFSKNYRKASLFSRMQRNLLRLWLLADCRKVIYAGGSLFSDIGKFRYALDMTLLSSGTKFYALGISVGPFIDPSAELRTISYLSRFTLISVRDNRSLSLLAKNGIKASITPDIVFSIGAEIRQWAEISNFQMVSPRILLAPTVVQKDQRAMQYQLFTTLDKIFSEKNWYVDVASMQQEENHPLFQQRNPYRYSGDFKEVVRLIKNYDLVVTSRLHVGIVCCILGIPFYLFKHHIKISDFLAEMKYPFDNRFDVFDFCKAMQNHPLTTASIDISSQIDFAKIKLLKDLEFILDEVTHE